MVCKFPVYSRCSRQKETDVNQLPPAVTLLLLRHVAEDSAAGGQLGDLHLVPHQHGDPGPGQQSVDSRASNIVLPSRRRPLLDPLPLLDPSVVGAFNQEKALVGVFSVIVKLRVIFANVCLKL